jgi:hypothetical protein
LHAPADDGVSEDAGYAAGKEVIVEGADEPSGAMREGEALWGVSATLEPRESVEGEFAVFFVGA